MTTETIPASGTKAAVRYWAHRTRESLRDAERCAREGNYGLAEDLAVQASGEAGEFAIAMQAVALERGA